MKQLIKIPTNSWFSQHGVSIPGRTYQQRSFKFAPNDFVPDAPQLKDKMYDSLVQERSLSHFLENPTYPATYGVGGEPNDSQAMYFAAYLASAFIKARPSGTVVWHSLTGGFDSDLLLNSTTADLLILSNLTKDSSKTRLEKTRDLLEHYSTIPRIVVISGEDPPSFFSTKLYFKLTHMFFAGSQNFKRRVEVV